MRKEEAVQLHKGLCKPCKLQTTVHEATGLILTIRCMHCSLEIYDFLHDTSLEFNPNHFMRAKDNNGKWHDGFFSGARWPKCMKCGRESVYVDTSGLALCSEHCKKHGPWITQ